MQEFDYSMFEEDPHWSSDCLSDPNYWGIHLIDGRMVIDVPRYKKTFEGIGASEFIPRAFMERVLSYFEPLKKQRYDYKIKNGFNINSKFITNISNSIYIVFDNVMDNIINKAR